MALLKKREDIEFVLMGEGLAKAELEKKARASGARVRFVGHQPVGVAKLAMRQADLGYVSLVPGMYRYAYPSKTMTYLEQECPLVVAVEAESQLATDVEQQGYGLTVPMGDAAALARALERVADSREQLRPMRAAAARKAHSEFSEAVVLGEWSALLKEGEVAYG